MLPVVRLSKQKSRVARILPEIQDLFRIRNLRRELARDLDLAHHAQHDRSAMTRISLCIKKCL